MCLILTLVCLYKATSFDIWQGGSAYPPDPGGGRAGLALWGWDNPKGTRHGFMSSFPSPASVTLSWVPPLRWQGWGWECVSSDAGTIFGARFDPDSGARGLTSSEQTLLERRQPRMLARPPVALPLLVLEVGTDSPSNLDAFSFFVAFLLWLEPLGC